jgi:hypothetical protein
MNHIYWLIGVPGDEYPKLAEVGRELEKSDPASEPRSLPPVPTPPGVVAAFGVEGRSPKTKATRSSIAFLSLPVVELVVVVYLV